MEEETPGESQPQQAGGVFNFFEDTSIGNVESKEQAQIENEWGIDNMFVEPTPKEITAPQEPNLRGEEWGMSKEQPKEVYQESEWGLESQETTPVPPQEITPREAQEASTQEACVVLPQPPTYPVLGNVQPQETGKPTFNNTMQSKETVLPKDKSPFEVLPQEEVQIKETSGSILTKELQEPTKRPSKTHKTTKTTETFEETPKPTETFEETPKPTETFEETSERTDMPMKQEPTLSTKEKGKQIPVPAVHAGGRRIRQRASRKHLSEEQKDALPALLGESPEETEQAISRIQGETALMTHEQKLERKMLKTESHQNKHSSKAIPSTYHPPPYPYKEKKKNPMGQFYQPPPRALEQNYPVRIVPPSD
jgi:hypothetical protein